MLELSKYAATEIFKRAFLLCGPTLGGLYKRFLNIDYLVTR
jgi:hypothetical protein